MEPVIGYRFWGNLSQKYLAQSHHHHLFLYGDPFKLAAEELSQGKTPFGHILLELWLTQGDGAWLNQSQTCLLNFSQLVERPKPIIREISAFLGLTTTKKTLQELLSVHPLPAPKPASSSKGFGAKSAPRVETLTPAQQLLLTIFLRPSRFIWFSAKEDDYDQRLEELFNATAAEAWQELLQDMTGLLVDHLGDRLGDWLKTAYDHGVVPLRAENPQGAAQLLFTLGEQLREQEKEAEAKILYQEVLQLNSQDIGAAFTLGQLSERQGNIAEAVGYYQQVLRQDSLNEKALLRLADLSRAQKNFAQAEDYLQQVLRQDPQNKIALYWLIKILEDQGQLDRAQEWVEEKDLEFIRTLPDYLSHTGGSA